MTDLERTLIETIRERTVARKACSLAKVTLESVGHLKADYEKARETYTQTCTAHVKAVFAIETEILRKIR